MPIGVKRTLQGATLQNADGVRATLGVYALAIVQEPFRREPCRKAARRTGNTHLVGDISARGELLNLHVTRRLNRQKERWRNRKGGKSARNRGRL